MAQIIPLNSRNSNSASPRRWHRSFPPRTIAGNDWMLTVLDDLIAFSQDKELGDIAAELRDARDRIAPRLPAPSGRV